ncbi:hypothetical protein BVC80_1787g196 [Macleaya cordata]|uniref:DUF7642 domain-containing protein n=1 Tax=Macleaya cordata TaxID=56857 RepID=A0A200QUF3_MACCD|nr:hypothetical protein BVC80_1787g196 [Macleaya cordata]
MLSGHAVDMRDYAGSNELLLAGLASELDDDEAEISGKIIYEASFEDLAGSHLQYDTVIWVLISLLLVLAWGVGILMLLYLPIRRYVLQKDFTSRRLYITSNEIVYKVTRPFFLPFFGVTKIEKRIPLALVIDIIIEQGCLQSAYGIHTFRIESIAYGKATPVDELQFQGVSNPGHLRKVIMTEASKLLLAGRGRKPTAYTGERESTPVRGGSVTEGPIGRSPFPSWKHVLQEARGTLPDLVLHKLDEVTQSMKRIESLMEKPQALPESS